VLKAQHPEFEMWNQGIHARSGVACADCHMPYVREGAMKVSDHWVRSPVLNINRACQTCHRWPEQELKDRVETIQTRHFQLRNRAMDAVVALIGELEEAKAKGKTDAELGKAQGLQRKAQFYLDFVEAENSTGFHAPQEAARILGESIDLARQGQLEVRAVVLGCPKCAEASATSATCVELSDAGAPDAAASSDAPDAGPAAEKGAASDGAPAHKGKASKGDLVF
jgi:nitrite reductase (cytochrome c-552)